MEDKDLPMKDHSSGRDCFFSESTFLRVMGTGPPLVERLQSLSSRPKTQEIKKKIKVHYDKDAFKTALQNFAVADEKTHKNLLQKETKKDSVKVNVSSIESQNKAMKQDIPHSNSALVALNASEEEEPQIKEIDTNLGDIVNEMEIIDTDDNVMQQDTINQDIEESNSGCTQMDVIEENEKSSKMERESSHNPTTTLVDLDQQTNMDDNSKPVFDSEDSLVEKSVRNTPDKMGEMATPEKNEGEEVCCLVMANTSDDDCSDEDVCPFNGMEKSTNISSTDASKKPETTGGQEENPEDGFCLVMTGLSSPDERSGKEDASDFYNLHRLDSINGNKYSLRVSSSNQLNEESNRFKGYEQPNSCKSKSPENLQNVIKKENYEMNKTVKIEDNASAKQSALKTDESFTDRKIESSCSTKDDVGSAIGFPRNDQPLSAGPSTANGGKKNQEKNVVFRDQRSKLTKKEHKRYIQLYKKYVCPMMKGNRKAVYSEAELKDLVELEELQQRVSQEQVVYQEYLKQKAMKNPSAYNFLKNASRVYSHSRYSSYHKPRNFLRNFEIESMKDIPLLLQEGKTPSVLMTFRKMLLKLGHSPRVTLPDVKDGANPVAVKADLKAINSLFPSNNRMAGSSFVDHKMISVDSNAARLAEEEEVDIVLSSSSFKCLLDNHASDVMRAWDIPVTIRSNQSSRSRKKIVYLDKPLYRDDFPLREYNALYHKYALRTFVSRPRSQKSNMNQPGKINQSGTTIPTRRQSSFVADDLDMFSTDAVCDIETFGSFSNKRTRSSSINYSEASPIDTEQRHEDGCKLKDSTEVKTRFTRSKSVTKNETQTTDSSSSIPLQSSTPATKRLEGTTFDNKVSSVAQEESAAPLRRSTRLSSSNQAQPESNLSSDPNQASEGPPSKLVKTDVDTFTSSTTGSIPEIPKRKRGRPRKDQNLPESDSAFGQDSLQSDLTSSSVASHQDVVKAKDTEVTVETESPASPTMELESPASPTMELESPASPTMELESPASPTAMPANDRKVIEVPLSPVKRDSAPYTDRPVRDVLDSILGPSGDRGVSLNRSTDLDNPNGNEFGEFLQLEEKCGCMMYNLWSLGSLKVMLRCNYHGTVKDHNKARYVYLSPKMEYQPDSGMEQVTLSEMTRTWTSCFIRPGCNLVKARINAFTSEILMLEETPLNTILKPSLPFTPEHSFEVVRRLFEELRNLPEGQYLLSHLKGNKFCSMRKFHGKGSLMRPPKKKRSGRAKEGQVPWIPIDPTILTPFHIHNSRIPATFMPSDWILPVKKSKGGGNKNPSQQKAGWNNQNRGNKGK